MAATTFSGPVHIGNSTSDGIVSVDASTGVITLTDRDGNTSALVAATPQANIPVLTDSSGGSANGTVAAISGSGADAGVNDNFADLAAKVNAIIAALVAAGIIAAP